MKETFAFVNNQTQAGINLMKELAQQGFQVLYTLKDEADRNIWKEKLAEPQIEIVACPKEGCWEADIISFVNNGTNHEELIQKIQKVATQKIILWIESEENISTNPELVKLEKAFPFSMAIISSISPLNKKVEVTGKNKNSLKKVAAVFQNIGYSAFISAVKNNDYERRNLV